MPVTGIGTALEREVRGFGGIHATCRAFSPVSPRGHAGCIFSQECHALLMTQTVQLPLWLLLLILAFAAVTFASHFLFPSVRWFFRRRLEKAVARLNTRLERPIQPFKLARRFDMIERLSYDPQVLQAVAEHARSEDIPESVAAEQARRYAREIVPSFSASAYFGFAIRAARFLSNALFRVRLSHEDKRLGEIDREATVIFVMNHRSNMDYVLVTYLAADRSALSYAVGEWAQVWPLSRLIRAMGAYFIRRRSRNALYRRVLARYVALATDAGVTQAMFPEGGLSRTGALLPPKHGLLKYIVEGARDAERDVVFVPVALNYDRVLEDRNLIAAAQDPALGFARAEAVHLKADRLTSPTARAGGAVQQPALTAVALRQPQAHFSAREWPHRNPQGQPPRFLRQVGTLTRLIVDDEFRGLGHHHSQARRYGHLPCHHDAGGARLQSCKRNGAQLCWTREHWKALQLADKSQAVSLRPFQQLPFARLPERPTPAHPFFDWPAQRLAVSSQSFGQTTVAYREFGAGSPVLLVHGLMTSSYSWRYFMPLLAEHHRVIAIDLPGSGDSDKPDVVYGAAELAIFIAETQAALGLRGCPLIGNSLGGYLCMWLALQQPDATGALVNIHSPGVPLARLWALRSLLRAPAAPRLLDWMVRSQPERWVHKNVHYWHESRKSREEAREYARPLRSPEGRAAFASYLRDALDPAMMKQFVTRLERAPFEVPLQLIYSRRDPLVPPQVGEQLHALVPGAEMVRLDSCSHFAHVDRPQAVLDAVLPFLRRHAAPAVAGSGS